MEKESSRERVGTHKRLLGVGTACRNRTFEPDIVLKLPRDPHSHASILMQCLFSIGHGLLPRNACFPLITAYTHALLVLHWSRPPPTYFYSSGITPTHVFFLVVTLLIISTTRYICQLYPPCSSPVNAIYYTYS